MSPKTFVNALLILPCIATAAGPNGKLNDTGQTQCLNADGNGLEPCSYKNTGKFSNYPGQDGRFGRDAEALKENLEHSNFQKPVGSGGNGGFAFTPLDVNGNQIALIEQKEGKWVPSADPRCIWDRVTNLIWEVKTDKPTPDLQDKDWTYGGNYHNGKCHSTHANNCSTKEYTSQLNALTTPVCPVSGAEKDWRLPTRRELLSIVDHGRENPSVDDDYFKNTIGDWYFSSNIGYGVWSIDFRNGDTVQNTSSPGYIRLVRSGPRSP